MKLAPVLSLALLTSCAAVKSDVKAFANGAVTCLKADEPAAIALGKALLTNALAGFLAGQSPTDVWAKAKADAESAALAQGLPVAACAFDGVIADISHILHPPAPAGTATQGLMARVEADPMAAGKAALAAFEASHGVTSVVR